MFHMGLVLNMCNGCRDRRLIKEPPHCVVTGVANPRLISDSELVQARKGYKLLVETKSKRNGRIKRCMFVKIILS